MVPFLPSILIDFAPRCKGKRSAVRWSSGAERSRQVPGSQKCHMRQISYSGEGRAVDRIAIMDCNVISLLGIVAVVILAALCRDHCMDKGVL